MHSCRGLSRLLNEGPCVSDYPRYVAGQRFNVYFTKTQKDHWKKVGWPTSLGSRVDKVDMCVIEVPKRQFMSWGVILSNFHQTYADLVGCFPIPGLWEKTPTIVRSTIWVFWPTIGNRIPTITNIYIIYIWNTKNNIFPYHTNTYQHITKHFLGLPNIQTTPNGSGLQVWFGERRSRTPTEPKSRGANEALYGKDVMKLPFGS